MSAMPHTPVSPDPPPRILRCRDKSLSLDGRPKMAGILNATPDSFFDGGRHQAPEAALAQADRMLAEGAALIDVGGQSTRPGHVAVGAEEEQARVIPLLRALARRTAVPLSIDTHQPDVARAAVLAGADLINDVHGLHRHPELAAIAAEHGCAMILMHQDATFAQTDGGTIERIAAFLTRSLELAVAGGVSRDRIIMDPGIGFAKTQAQNLEILARLGELRALGCPLLLGASRKSVIGNVLALPPADRLEGTLATTALAVAQGVEFLRVHDVAANLRAALMAAAIRAAAPAKIRSGR